VEVYVTFARLPDCFQTTLMHISMLFMHSYFV